MKNRRVSLRGQIAYRHFTLIDRDLRCAVRVRDDHIEYRPAHGDDGGRAGDLIWIRHSRRMLDEDLHAAEPYVQEVLPVARRLAKNDLGIRKDLERASVGNFEARVPIGP